MYCTAGLRREDINKSVIIAITNYFGEVETDKQADLDKNYKNIIIIIILILDKSWSVGPAKLEI